MIVVSDNSPLQYLILIGCADCLPTLYGEAVTTPQVVAELTHPRAPDPVRAWTLARPSWLKVEAPRRMQFLETLDLGEASALSLAKERGASLILIDDRAGNEAAHGIRVESIGTLGVLIEAGLDGLIDFERALAKLADQTAFYATPRLLAAARQIYRERRKAE